MGLARLSPKDFNKSDVCSLVEDLSWRIKEGSFSLFARQFTYCGIEWHLDTKTLSLPEQKRAKYLRQVKEALMEASTRKLKLLEVKVGLTASSTPTVRAYLSSLPSQKLIGTLV